MSEHLNELLLFPASRAVRTFDHVHGGRRSAVAGVAYGPHRVLVATPAVERLHEGPVEAHHTWVTCDRQHEVIEACGNHGNREPDPEHDTVQIRVLQLYYSNTVMCTTVILQLYYSNTAFELCTAVFLQYTVCRDV